MSTASVAVLEKSVPQTIGASSFFFTAYRSSSVQEFLTGNKTWYDLLITDPSRGPSTKQTVRISGNVKTRCRLKNKEIFISN
jgi:hypothetical protein